MADQAQDLQSPGSADGPLAGYAPPDRNADLYMNARPDVAEKWREVAADMAALGGGELQRLQANLDQQVEDLGLAFRLIGDEQERAWPLNPAPLIIGAQEWDGLEQGLVQRADLLEQIIADIYGPQDLVKQGLVPAAVISGSPNFARRMVGLKPPGGHFVNVCAFDLARGPGGEWRVLTDRVRLPVGIGYALENRMAIARTTGGLIGKFGVRRQQEFFDALRQGMAANCQRADPRIALLTPGRFTQSYPEQAHLARHLGFPLVEGRDLVVRDAQLYVRTIAGLRRIDALWRWINARDIDPLHFDSRSRIGVPGLISAAENGAVLANWPGAGVVESRAFPAFLPRLARHLLGQPLKLPNMATWWCGGEAERREVLERFDELVISSAFHQKVAGLTDGRSRPGNSFSADERAQLLAAIERRPMDYTAQEIVRLSTTPVAKDGGFAARGFTLRAFLTRDGQGNWVAMPGGFARISHSGNLRTSLMGQGDKSIDVWILDPKPRPDAEPLAVSSPGIRREQGLLPAQAADNLFWMGRYGERLNQTSRAVRALIGQISGSGAETRTGTATARLANLLRRWGAVPPASISWFPSRLAEASLTGSDQAGSVRQLAANVRDMALLLRDRIKRDPWRIIHRPFPECRSGNAESMVDACDVLIERYAAFMQLSSEGMSRNPAWRFLEMGLRLERALLMLQAAQTLVPGSASAEDLSALLDLTDNHALFRSRYLAMPTIAPVLDMVLLDPAEPRSAAFQIARIEEHLAQLPPLREDGMPEAAFTVARRLSARFSGIEAAGLTSAVVDDLLHAAADLSNTISRSYFLQQESDDAGKPQTLLA